MILGLPTPHIYVLIIAAKPGNNDDLAASKKAGGFTCAGHGMEYYPWALPVCNPRESGVFPRRLGSEASFPRGSTLTMLLTDGQYRYSSTYVCARLSGLQTRLRGVSRKLGRPRE